MRTLTAAVVLSALTACGASSDDTGHANDPAVAVQPVVAAAPAAAGSPVAEEKARDEGPVVEDTTFRLALAKQADGALSLELEARGGYHVNQEFPFSADFSGSSEGVTLSKSALSKADAKQFGEERAVFELPYTLAGADGIVRAKVRFAVCTEETCVPDRRTLALSLAP